MMKYLYKTRLKFTIALLFCIIFSSAWGQTKEQKKLELALTNAKTETKKTEAYLALGKYYMKTDFVRLDSLLKIVEKESSSYSKVNRVKLLLLVSDGCDLIGDYETIHKMFPYFEGLDYTGLSPQLHGQILGNIGYEYMVRNDRKLAQKNLNKALSLAKSSKDYSLATTILNLKAFESLIYKEKEKALRFSDEAINYAKLSDDPIDLAYCFNTKANIYQYYGENDISFRKNFLAFKIAKNQNAHYQISRFAMEMGSLQENVSNLSGAKYYYRICLENATKIKDNGQVGHALGYLANILRQEKKFMESQALNYKALAIIDEKANPIRVGDVEASLGLNYIDLGLNSKASEHLEKAIALYQVGQNKNRESEILFFLGKLRIEQKKYNEALKFLLQSKEFTEKFGSPSAVYRTYPLIAKIYNIQGKKDLALEMLTKYIEFSEKEKEKKASEKIAQLGEEFRAEERDRMISQQSENLEKQKNIRKLTQAELENAQLRSRLQTYFILAFIIVAILATVIGIYRFRQAAIQRKRKQAEMSQTLLRSQMNPHFIFNAMSVIQSYIYDNDVEKSSQFLVSFSRLIRLILENSPKEYISIETEIEILTKYLETQKLRFEKRFDFEIICPGHLIFDKALIPPMLTQPFVENAIEHGELHLAENGKIIIRFKQTGDLLHVEIEDNGVGRKKSEKNKDGNNHTSMATTITEERIRIINEKENSKGYLAVNDAVTSENSGTIVIICLPFKKDMSSN